MIPPSERLKQFPSDARVRQLCPGQVSKREIPWTAPAPGEQSHISVGFEQIELVVDAMLSDGKVRGRGVHDRQENDR